MNFQVARYVIRAYVIPAGKERFSVEARADPLNDGGAPLDKSITCEPCSYEQARIACYKLVAELAANVKAQGAMVADVTIFDDGER
jgi:hypothetical protein